jgi:metal-responsive CopG/Arc/MetJ family transcriptional regulator
MAAAVKKTISLPADLARELEETAHAEGKSVSAVVQDALRLAKREYLKQQYRGIQSHWSTVARQKGILTEKDLQRYLER